MDYINRMKVCTPPTPSRSTSSSNFNLSSMTTIKNAFQPKFIDTLQDQQLFNWGYTFFTRSGANTPSLLSRSSSFSAAATEDTDVSIEHVYHIRKDE